MTRIVATLAIGFVAGVLSGAFGIGGGIVTTPGLRLLLNSPALIAVGTPLPVIFPSAVTGAVNYYRKGLIDVRAGLTCGLVGAGFAVIGALATRWVGGTIVLLATASVILYTAADMVLQVLRPPTQGGAEVSSDPQGLSSSAPASEPWGRLAAIGALTGLYSGFLGLGGGFILVPLLTRWLRFDIKRAIATSLLAILILAVPGTVTHALLGHIDWVLAGLLVVGVVPGAWIGSRITISAGERSVRLGFAVMLLVVGGWLAVSELARLL